MKHIITAIFLALAVAAGLLLPEAFMDWKDRELEIPQLVSVTEPTLEWNPSKAQSSEEEVSGEEIARRLALFQDGPQVTVPIGNYTDDEMVWAASRAVDFLNMVCETEPDIYSADAEYQLAWFEDGTAFPFWTAYVSFNGSWRCLMTIDGESGATLQCIINPNGKDLSELFPESFERAATEPDTYFEELVAQRFCDALGFFMGRNDGGENPVSLSKEPDSVYISFADDPSVSVTVRLYVDLVDGIWFNHS